MVRIFDPKQHQYKFKLPYFEHVGINCETQDRYIYIVLEHIARNMNKAISTDNFKEEATKLINDALSIDLDSCDYLRSITYAKEHIDIRINRILYKCKFDDVTRAKFRLLGYRTT